MRLSATLLLVSRVAISIAVTQRDTVTPCCFSIVAQGTVNGHLGEDGFGQIGIGPDFPQSTFCIYNTTVTDSGGQPCTILSSNGQFVCKADSTPTSSRFTLADSGDLLHDGKPDYLACPSPGISSDGSYNIFSDGVGDTSSRCADITLLTGGFSCAALGRPLSSTSTVFATSPSTQLQFVTAAAPAITLSPISTSTSTSSTIAPACPTNISSGFYLPPNLIIPISPLTPATSYGTQYTATITPHNSTVFAFDIPYTYTGTCAMIFTFPFSSDAQFPYVFSGIEEEDASEGGLSFALLNGAVNDTTTFESLPSVASDYGVTAIFPRENYTVAVGACAAGQRVGYLVSSVGGVVLEFFQSTGRSPVGVWVVLCG